MADNPATKDTAELLIDILDELRAIKERVAQHDSCCAKTAASAGAGPVRSASRPLEALL